MMDRQQESAERDAVSRQQLLAQIAEEIPNSAGGSCVRVAIDGPDGAGKTTFADELAATAAERLVADPCDVTIQTYDREIDRYLQSSGPPSAQLRSYLDRFAALTHAGHVLELGSGPGNDADYLESRGVRVERSDATPSFVERLRAHGHSARILDARANDYGGPFDGVLADAVLLHLSRLQFAQALLTAHQATRPGGALGITLKEGGGAAWSTAKLGRARRFTYWREEQLREVLHETGWAPESIEHVDGRTEPWLFVLARSSTARIS